MLLYHPTKFVLSLCHIGYLAFSNIDPADTHRHPFGKHQAPLHGHIGTYANQCRIYQSESLQFAEVHV
jgi:hypothetical protein